MKKLIILLLTMTTIQAAAAVSRKPLTMDNFITTALANNPAVQRIRATYNESRSLSAKTAALKDLFLSAGTAWSWYNKVFSGGTLSATDKNEWSVYATLSKKFPKLLGMDTSLSFAHSSILSTDSGGSSDNSHTPSLTLTLTIPLLKNFLGRVDKNDLKKMNLAMHMADRYETEALEALLVTLKTAYINWALASEKASIYRGSMNRAALLLNQTLRKQRMGIADAADLALARQNYLLYRSKMLAAETDSSSYYHTLLSLMRGKIPKKGEAIRILHKPVMDWKKTEIKTTGVQLSDLRLVQIARLSLEDARLALSSANSQIKPDLNFIFKAGTGSSKTSMGTAFSSLDQNNLYGGLEFSLSLQNTEQKEAKKAAVAAMKKYALEYKELLISLDYGIRSQERTLKLSGTELRLQQQVVVTSLIRINATYRKYRQGRATLSQVTDARDAYASQQIAYIEKAAALKKLLLEYRAQTDRLSGDYPLKKK